MLFRTTEIGVQTRSLIEQIPHFVQQQTVNFLTEKKTIISREFSTLRPSRKERLIQTPFREVLASPRAGPTRFLLRLQVQTKLQAEDFRY